MNVKEIWLTLENPDDIQHAYYIIARGLTCKHPQDAQSQLERLKKAFGPVVNKNKLSNGRWPYDTLDALLWRLQFARSPLFPVEEELHEQIKEKAKELRGML